MVYVALTNKKLRQRGARILEEAAGVNSSAAEHALRQARHSLPLALVMLKSGATAQEALHWLHASGGNLREAIAAAARRRSRSKARVN
jgi:N-acetylmuramic acid 6-phosphate etherase